MVLLDPVSQVGVNLLVGMLQMFDNCMPTAPGLPLSVTLTSVWDGVDLASPPIKRYLNICQGTIDDAVGLFKNITNATLIILENDSTMSCKKTYNFA